MGLFIPIEVIRPPFNFIRNKLGFIIALAIHRQVPIRLQVVIGFDWGGVGWYGKRVVVLLVG